MCFGFTIKLFSLERNALNEWYVYQFLVQTSPMATVEPSPEYLVFRENYTLLIDIVKADPGYFCDVLFSNGYISNDIRDYTRTIAIPETEKARRLIDAVIDQIEYKPSVFHGFVEALKGSSHSYQIATKLELSCVTRCKHIQSGDEIPKKSEDCLETVPFGQTSYTALQDHKRDSDDSSSACAAEGFVCPYCAKCSLEQYLSEEGCPHMRKETLFPHLDTSALSEHEIMAFKMQLKRDAQGIIDCFAELISSTIKSLEERNESLDGIKDTLLSFTTFADDALLESLDITKIQEALSIQRLFIVLRRYISFYNYGLVEHLIEVHGSEEDHKRLADYITKFVAFCERSVFEVPHGVFGSRNPAAGKSFVFKYTERVLSLLDVRKLADRIATIFGLRRCALQLHSISAGCVELHFMISTAVADRIFPVSPSQHTALSEIGVRVLSSDRGDHEKDENHK